MAAKKDDWRLPGQESYLKGATLSLKTYVPYRDDWDHDHCSFCWAKFMEKPGADILTEGYATPDNYHWVCKKCFEDFKDLFEWKTT